MSNGPFHLCEVLEKEYQELYKNLPDYPRRPLSEIDKEKGLTEKEKDEKKKAEADKRLSAICDLIHERARNGDKRAALCFSGGGIRSATFGLGVLQGLARKKLLTEFDYLSTVSGGGYLGGWFSAWLRRESERSKKSARDALRDIQDELNNPPAPKLQPEPETVRHLRSYSNYMSPRLGLLSADTWTLVAIYFRNLFLIQLVLVPLIFGVLVIPRLSLAVARWGGGGGWTGFAYLLAVVFGILAIAFIIANRPSIADPKPSGLDASRLREKYRGEWWFLILCVAPLLVLASAITTYWAWLRAPMDQLRLAPFGNIHNAFSFAFFGMLLYGGAYVVAQILLLRRVLLAEPFFAVPTGLIGGLLTYLVAANIFDNPIVKDTETATVLSTSLYVCFAAPTFLILFLIASTLFVGFASRKTTDADREWLARAGAWVLIAAALWIIVSVIVIFGPVALFYFGPKIITAIGSAAGIVTIGGGTSGQTAANNKEEKKQNASGWTQLLKRYALALAAPVFAVFLLIIMSLATTLLYRAIYDALAGAGSWADWYGLRSLLAIHEIKWDAYQHLPYDSYGFLNIIYHLPGRFVFALSFVVVLAGFLMGLCVNINKFSLHAAYRDRLIRAYLGASRPKSERRPNPFTGFDEADNMPMSELAERPLHVVNMTLNLVSLSGEQLAWQDRKAESFTSSRLYSGSFCLGYRDSKEYGYDKAMERGISLGTAVAISGAAASPNMGYYSSTFVTFLLSLFNVRLGWWLGNPGKAGDSTYDKSGPTYGPRPIIAETLGWTDDRHPYVYLSDGGHFENLGLYEMVLRRCHTIVVSDGSADPTFTFSDLGNAVSKIRDDLGIPILFDNIPVTPKDRDEIAFLQADDLKEKFCAVGTICYKKKDGETAVNGTIIYIKPNIYGGEPADVFHYAKSNPAFPHESTADQMYSESQFESYRALGEYIVNLICKGGTVTDIESFQTQARCYLGNPPGTTTVPLPECSD
ncbi:MAG TPA: patatin-like phospholipase family protein [Pyrinomonadaceae bacterium]|nr:patatin-like phospholipase family protein [Pyrinomonadaceae bacterium]